MALCDVDWDRAAGSFKKFDKAAKYKDFRIMLEEQAKTIDAVIVATPDHMHAPIALMAMKMGKHVYVEKPMAHNVYETRLMVEAARKLNVVTQMGIQGHSNEGTRLLCEWIWQDAIGPVREVHYWTNRPIWPQGIYRPTEPMAVPPNMDWDLWLGVAAERPYHSCYAPFNWRGWWDFGCGALGDIGCHAMDAAFWALKLGYPERIESTSSRRYPETAPKESTITYYFPKRRDPQLGKLPAVKMIWHDGVKKPPKIEALEKDRQAPEPGAGLMLFVGDKGQIMSPPYCSSPRLIPETAMKEFLASKPEKTLPRSPGHHEEWIAACKGEGATGANFEYSAPLTEVVLLGNASVRLGQPIDYDAEKMRITNSQAANSFLRREYRKGWEI
ncbi:MAG: Glucose--fructose oxidoreductase precursor [candidate division BRC1 bacterium ADurb.BinA364]|nr:MAG: Glucose--fructose oxidoreductase precursor [candidate division BRC1 bacterium ADurb.BinA364]